MKRKTALLLITILIGSSLFSCGLPTSEEIQNEKVEAGVLKEYNDLIDASKNFTSVEKFDNYLLKWANERDIRASYDKYKNVIMSKSPSEGHSNEDSVNIQTTIGLSNMEDRCIGVAMSLYLIENAPENNFMRIIFTNNDKGDFSGAKGLSSRYLNADNQINLDWSYDQQNDPPEFSVINGSAATATHKMFTSFDYTTSVYSKAYEVSISHLNGGKSSAYSGKHPNPIKILGDLMASCKSSGILFELASFNGGNAPDTYPADASLTLVINENDVNRFTKKVETAQNKFSDSYSKTEESYTYTLTEIPKPENVLNLESTNSIVSLLYTLDNGVILRDEETNAIITVSNIGQVSTVDGEFQLLIFGRSLSTYELFQLNDTFDIIGSLSEVTHTLIEETPLWPVKEVNPLLERVTLLGAEKYGVEPDVINSFEKTENAIFRQNENLKNLLSIKVNRSNYIVQTQLLLDILNEPNPTV